jgi:hypothetical protein
VGRGVGVACSFFAGLPVPEQAVVSKRLAKASRLTKLRSVRRMKQTPSRQKIPV